MTTLEIRDAGNGGFVVRMAETLDWPVGKVEWEVTFGAADNLPLLELQAKATELEPPQL